jgi:hypothetical protein
MFLCPVRARPRRRSDGRRSPSPLQSRKGSAKGRKVGGSEAQAVKPAAQKKKGERVEVPALDFGVPYKERHVLALEVKIVRRPAKDLRGHSPTHSRDERCQPAVGSAMDSFTCVVLAVCRGMSARPHAFTSFRADGFDRGRRIARARLGRRSEKF